MPQVALAAGNFLASVFVVQLGIPVGVVATAAAITTQVALTVAVTAASTALTRPPQPEVGKSTVLQERPPRAFGVGKCRVSGPFMLREVFELNYTQIIALPEGPVDHYGRYWLNDDEVTVISNQVQGMDDRRYPTGKVRFETRLGEDTETAYSTAVADFPGLWTTNHRGDGVPSILLRLTNGDKDKFSRDYPNGVQTTPSIEAFYRAYDWRDEAQDPDDNTTWTYSANPVVWLVNVLWRRFGADWDERFAPSLDILTAEADVCDEAVDLAAGGTEPRYECGFFFLATNAAADVIAIILASMDGWFGQRSDGAYIIRAGHYIEPTVIFGDKEIYDYEFNPGPTPDAARNYLTISFTDPAAAYSKVETTPWADETDIALRGEEKRQDFYPQAVQSNGQVRRLGKPALHRLLTPHGTFRTPLSARRGMGERFVGLNISECDDLNGVVVELGEYTIDLASASIVWTYQLADAAIYSWNPETEEGDGPSGTDRPTPEVLDDPDIDDVTAFYEATGGGTGVRLSVEATGPDRADLTWAVRWRVDGATSWVEAEASDIDPLSPVVLETGFVTADETIQVQVAYRTGSGVLSDWSPTIPFEVDTTTDGIAPAPCTLPSASSPGAGAADFTFRNSVSTNFDHARVFRHTANVFGSASDVSGELTGGLGADTLYQDTGLTAGTYWYWAVAENIADEPSAPTTGVSVVVA